MSQQVSHKAIVESVEPHWVSVAMEVRSACAGCKARQICGTGEESRRRITIQTPDAGSYRAGEEVVVSMRCEMGLWAIFIAYLLPLLLMLATLLALLQNGVQELTAGVAALGVAALYYTAVWLLRDKIQRQIVFTLSKSE